MLLYHAIAFAFCGIYDLLSHRLTVIKSTFEVCWSDGSHAEVSKGVAELAHCIACWFPGESCADLGAEKSETEEMRRAAEQSPQAGTCRRCLRNQALLGPHLLYRACPSSVCVFVSAGAVLILCSMWFLLCLHARSQKQQQFRSVEVLCGLRYVCYF